MKIHRMFLTFAIALLLVANEAQSATVGFVEDFPTDHSNWFFSSGSGADDLVNFVPAGGPDGGSYAQGTYNFLNSTSASNGPAIFRARQSFGASGGQLHGNWISDGVNRITAMVRHDASDPATGDPLPLDFFTRIATDDNHPAAAIETFSSVPPNVWTPLTFDIFFGNPLLTLEGAPTPPFFNSVFSSVGRVQFGVALPSALVGVDQTVTFGLDKVTLVPEPATAALGCFGAVAVGLVLRRRSAIA